MPSFFAVVRFLRGPERKGRKFLSCPPPLPRTFSSIRESFESVVIEHSFPFLFLPSAKKLRDERQSSGVFRSFPPPFRPSRVERSCAPPLFLLPFFPGLPPSAKSYTITRQECGGLLIPFFPPSSSIKVSPFSCTACEVYSN